MDEITRDLPTPVTREEQYLAKAAGMNVEIPKPITRTEKYLQAVANSGGGSGGGGAFILRPTAEELTRQNNGAIVCTTNFDEMAKAVESGALVYVVFPESFSSSGIDVKEVLLLLNCAQAYNGDTLVIAARFLDFDEVPSNALGRILFVNGAYVMNL